MSGIKILGLTAPRRHGKDSFARLLKGHKQGLSVLDYALADELKRDVAPLIMEQFGIDVFTADGKEKELIRPILIAYGCAWRDVDPLHWVRVVNKNIEFDRPDLAIVKDIRFANEANFFRDAYLKGFHLLGITRIDGPEPTDEERRNIPSLKPLIDSNVTWGGGEYTDEILMKTVIGWGKYFL